VVACGYEGRLANLYQRLSKKYKPEDPAVPAAVPVAGIPGVPERAGAAPSRPAGERLTRLLTALRKSLVKTSLVGPRTGGAQNQQAPGGEPCETRSNHEGSTAGNAGVKKPEKLK
jgi:hypothetical protein